PQAFGVRRTRGSAAALQIAGSSASALGWPASSEEVIVTAHVGDRDSGRIGVRRVASGKHQATPVRSPPWMIGVEFIGCDLTEARAISCHDEYRIPANRAPPSRFKCQPFTIWGPCGRSALAWARLRGTYFTSSAKKPYRVFRLVVSLPNVLLTGERDPFAVG